MFRYSTGFRNAIGSSLSWAQALADSRLFIYSGGQPNTADDDINGSLLLPFTDNGGVYTAPVRAQATIGLSGVAGQVDSIKVGGGGENLLSVLVPFATTLNDLAIAVADNINAKMNALGIVASPSGSNVLLYAPYHLGADANGLTIAVVASGGITAAVNGSSSLTFGGAGAPAVGVNSAGGLNFGLASSGVIQKTGTLWSGTVVASGTAGWFRLCAGGSNYLGLSTTDVRIDGSIAASGADLNLAVTSLLAGSVQTISGFRITIPAQ